MGSCCCVCLLGHRMENFHCDWGDKGGNAGACWECWKCEPCCGEPCGVVPAIKCILCFWCCNPCSMGKLFSHTLEQDCAVVNHCLYACFCGICMHTCLRHNLRGSTTSARREDFRSIASWRSSAARALDARSSAP